jgi:hypothetical protein
VAGVELELERPVSASIRVCRAIVAILCVTRRQF